MGRKGDGEGKKVYDAAKAEAQAGGIRSQAMVASLVSAPEPLEVLPIFSSSLSALSASTSSS
jgi:hypothetical protein